MIAWLLMAWRWILSSRIAQGIAAAGALIAYYTFRIWQAKREGARRERERARIDAYEKRAESEGDIRNARHKLDEQQQKRRERESSENPRDRFNRDPFGE